MQPQHIIIPKLNKSSFVARVAAMHQQAGALGLKTAIDDPKFTAEPLLIRTLASLTNAILESIPTGAPREAIYGNPELKIHPILRQLLAKCNGTSTADQKAH